MTDVGCLSFTYLFATFSQVAHLKVSYNEENTVLIESAVLMSVVVS